MPIWNNTTFSSGGGGGGGATDFLALTDTPAVYGPGLEIVRVNAGATALEFATPASGGLGYILQWGATGGGHYLVANGTHNDNTTGSASGVTRITVAKPGDISGFSANKATAGTTVWEVYLNGALVMGANDGGNLSYSVLTPVGPVLGSDYIEVKVGAGSINYPGACIATVYIE